PAPTAAKPAPAAAPAPLATNVVDDLIAVPSDPAYLGMAANEPEVNKLFRLVMKLEASDLHLKVGQPPMMRLRGDIRKTDMKPLGQEDMERLLLPHLKPNHRKIL